MLIVLFLKLTGVSAISNLPAKTNEKPRMFISSNNPKYLMVEYSRSFIIPNFSDIVSVSLVDLSDGTPHGIATRDDYSGSFRQAGEVFDRLVEGEFLKVKMNPCKGQIFLVRLVFRQSPGSLDSLPSEYKPAKVSQV